jgi:hypothetical protein
VSACDTHQLFAAPDVMGVATAEPSYEVRGQHESNAQDVDVRAWDKITASKNQEASPSFLKKRSKKLLWLSANIERQPRCLGNESFLVLFFKKELPSAALHQLFGLTP